MTDWTQRFTIDDVNVGETAYRDEYVESLRGLLQEVRANGFDYWRDYDLRKRIEAALAGVTHQPQAAVEPWDKSKCSCVYATEANTAAVRKGYEMGGYVKERCDYCSGRAADKSAAITDPNATRRGIAD